MKNENDLDSLILDFYKEIIDLYEYDKEGNKKIVFLECVLEKLIKIDRSSERDLDYLIKVIENTKEFDRENIRELNRLLEEIKNDIFNNMFLRNTIFKKMIKDSLNNTE